MKTKYLLFLSLLMLATGGRLSAQDFIQNYSFVKTGPQGPGTSFANTGVTSFFMSWSPQTSMNTCSIQADSSSDGSSWGSGDLIASQSCTTAGSAAAASLTSGKNFVRVNVTVMSGNGGLNVTLKGWGGAGGSSVSPTPGTFNSSFDPPLFQNYSLTTTGAQAAINLTANPVDTHTITWRPSGTVSTCQIQVDTSADSISWNSGAAIPTTLCTSPGQFSTSSPVVANYVRVNLTALTGGGTLTVVYSGRLAQPASSDGGGGIIQPCSGTPTGIPIKQGDFIIQNDTGNVNGATLTLTYRMILATGERKEFQQTGLAGAGGNGPTYNSFPLPEGCLVSASLTLLGGSVDSGQTYAQVFVGRNNSPVPNASSVQLIGAQLTSNYTAGWPWAWRASTDGQGFNQTITFANPSAGVNLVNGALSGTSIIGQKHWLSNIRFTLTSSASAANRQACITFKDAAGNIYYGNCVQGTQAASLIVTYDFTAGVGAQYPGAATLIAIPSTNVAGTANEVQSTLPSNMQFSDASTISITIIGIQAADQLSAIVVRTFWSHHVTD